MTQSHNITGGNALCASLTPDLSTENGQITTTSKQVAEHFGKLHKHVLRDIRDLLKDIPRERQSIFELTFQDVPGPNGSTRKEPFYRMTRDGFALLAMGFTGKEALQWKLAYITAFNQMEAELLARQQADAQQIKAQLYLSIDAAHQLADDFEAKYNGMTWDYLKLQRQLIRSLGAQIGLIKRRNAREAVLKAEDMKRQGASNEAIQQATGLNNNYLKQVFKRARDAGRLPPLLKSVVPEGAQATLDLQGA